MKSNILKRTLSLILALIMLVSVCTVAVVNTVAAEIDTATTGATITGGTTLYLDPTFWDPGSARFAAYLCNGSSAAKWYSAIGPNADGKYWITVSAGESHKNIIWCRMNPSNTTNDWSARWNQTGDLTWDGSNNLFTISQWDSQTSGWSSYTPLTEPGAPDDPDDKITISFVIGTGNNWIANDDAKIFVNDGAEITEMTETVDSISGHVMWTATVAANDSYTFNRTSYFFDEENALEKPWNKWFATGRGENTVYMATGSGEGEWQAESTVSAVTGDIENFWDDLWIAPADKNDVNHAIKVYYDGSEFNLFVPSYYDLSNVVVYSDHEKVTIGDLPITSGSVASLTVGTGQAFGFVDSDETTEKGKINIYQTVSTAAMMMTTNEELYTGTTAGLSASNAWPADSDINADNYNGVYKDAIETKGSYYFYDEEGELVNKPKEDKEMEKIKKIKGRGNSSFEASMRIYGKYAYNINLEEKVELIEGATKSKKWCMLANNVDHSMMRNTFIYALADDIDIKYGPETRLVDVYDNGKYLGAYTITEKVEYGGSTLMNDMENLDDGIEEANMEKYGYDKDDYPDSNEYKIGSKDADGNKRDGIMDYAVQKKATFTTESGLEYEYAYTDFDTAAIAIDYPELEEKGLSADDIVYEEPENYKEYNYLLEFELFSRYEAEACWFVSPRTKQAVVCKYPETASKAVMEWVISEYEAAEAAIYEGEYADIEAVLDVDSFAKMYLIQELALNLDSAATSYYVHNEVEFDADGNRTGSKLVSSPVWDYDWSFGSYAFNNKFVFDGEKVKSSDYMSNPEQMFVKDKALQTDGQDKYDAAGKTFENNYNFQAKLVHNDKVWERCQFIWTNDVVPALSKYIDNDYIDAVSQADDGKAEGKILTEWLPKFESSVEMNEARWDAYDGNYEVEEDGKTVTKLRDDWGTKVTSDYVNRSFKFYYQNEYSSASSSEQVNTKSEKSYANSVYYLNDWLVKRWNYMSSENGGDLYNEDYKLTYKFENVGFSPDQSADGSTLLVKPDATVTYGSNATEFKDVPAEELMYDVYLNNKLHSSYKFTEIAEIRLPIDERTNVHIVVYPAADTDSNAASDAQSFAYGEVPEMVTIYFKSSGSLRYAPTLTVNGEEYVMDRAENEFTHNPSRTQKYYWYSTTIMLDSAKPSTLMFTNPYSMRATATLSGIEKDGEYYFGCDNMNNGSVAVNLTGCDEYIKNFVKSATHMVYNDATDAGVAMTSIDGTVYKMGDTDGDNTLSILDATTIQLALVEKEEFDETQTSLSDYDLDEVTSIVDATMIQRYLVNN